jgi:putative nucleotidyltransferase with HDIG domain
MEDTVRSNILINKMIATLGELPSSPKIVSAVMKLTSDPNSDLADVEKFLSADQSMSAKLLKLSNSSFYGQRKSVSTLKQAILIIGFFTLRSLVVATSIHSLYSNKNSQSIEKRLWEHSLATAIGCRLLARKIRHNNLEECFMSGLLHDIGKLVMTQKLGQKYEMICKHVETDNLKFNEVEKSELGYSHCDIGMMLLSKWNLPKELINAVYFHHDPASDDESSIEDVPLSQIPIAYMLEVSNQLAKDTGHGFDDFHEESYNGFALTSIANLSKEDYEELKTTLQDQFEQELEAFEA